MKLIILVIALFYLAILLLFYFYQEFFIFHPSKTNQNHQYQFPTPFKEVFFDTPYNGRIHTLQFLSNEAKGVVFYLHGNAGNLEDWGWLYRDFYERNYDVVFMDYRGYGKSAGKLSQEALLQDAQIVYDAVLKKYPEESVVVYGRSIGTGIASYIAAKNNPAAVVLESPYFNLKDIVKRVAPFLPISLILRYPLKSNEYLQQVTCPIHILHGTDDTVVVYKSGLKLFQSVASKATLYSVEGGGHNDLSQFPEYTQMLQKALP